MTVYFDCCEHCEHDGSELPPDRHTRPCQHGCNDAPPARNESADIAAAKLYHDPYRDWVNGAPPEADRSDCMASQCPPPKMDTCRWPRCAHPRRRPGGAQ